MQVHNGKNHRALAMLATGTSVLAIVLAMAPVAVGSPLTHRTPATSSTSPLHMRHLRMAVPEGDQCFSNIRSATGSAYVSQNFESDFDAYDDVAADDFTLSQDCTLTAISVPGVYFNGAGPATSENVTIYADDDGKPGAVISSQTAVGADQAGTFDIDLQPVALSADTEYWVSVQANLDYSAGGEWGWDADAAQAGSPAQWENPGDGFGTGCTAWAELQACLGADGPDLEFALYGDTGISSDTFAGYIAPLTQGARTAAHHYYDTVTPSAECAGHPDGWYVAYDTIGVQTSDGRWIYTEVTITCHNGVAIYSTKLCILALGHVTCRPVHVPLAVGQPTGTQIIARKGSLATTITNLETGKSATLKTKIQGVPSQLMAGVTNLDAKLRQHDIDDVDPQQYTDVTIDGRPLIEFDPSRVTLYQDGEPAVQPSAIGADGMSFDLDYID